MPLYFFVFVSFFYLISSLRGIFQLAAAAQKVSCKYFIGKVCAKWLLGRGPGTNKLGAKLPVIGFYVCRLLNSWKFGVRGNVG